MYHSTLDSRVMKKKDVKVLWVLRLGIGGLGVEVGVWELGFRESILGFRV